MAIRRAAVFILTLGAMSLYVLIVFGVTTGVSLLFGASPGHLIPALIATAFLSVSYGGIRQRIAENLKGRLGAERISPEEAATELLQSWGGGESPSSDLLVSVAQLIGQATGAWSVEVRPTVAGWESATWESQVIVSSSQAFEHVVPIVFEGDLLGEISIRSKTAEGPTPRERQMIGGLSDQIALTVRNATLADEIQGQIVEITRRTSQVRAARRRTVAAQDAERRLLERNIHDGVQQYLVAMAVKLSLARRSTDLEKTAEALRGASRLAREALDRLEELTSGVSSQILIEEGLQSALRKAAEASPLPVEVIDAGVGRLPQEAEVAVYFSCLEALQNAIKHSDASRVTIRLGREGGELRFSVTDDGTGFEPETVKRGAGLRNLSDRLSGLQGTLEILSGHGSGTSIVGKVPIAQGVKR